MGHGLNHFIHRAVTTQHQNQVGTVGDRFAGQVRAVARAGGGQKARREASALQRRNGTLENTLRVPPEFASSGIVDEDRLAERRNPLIIAADCSLT